MKAGDFASKLAARFGFGKRFAPVSAWFIGSAIVRVDVVEIGPGEITTATGERLLSDYLFPSMPRLVAGEWQA